MFSKLSSVEEVISVV